MGDHAEEGEREQLLPGANNDNNPALVQTCCGKLRQWNSLEKVEWEFLVIALVTAIVMLVFSILRLHGLIVDQKPFSSEIVMAISEGFCLYYISHGIFFGRREEIIFYFIAIFVDVIYCTVDYFAMDSPTVYAQVRLAVDWFLGFITPFALGYYIITRNNNWEANYMRDFRSMVFFKSLLVFDLHFAICNVVFIVTERHVDTHEAVLLALGETANLVFFCIGKWLKENRNKCWTYVFMCLGLFPFIFVPYKITQQVDGIRNGVYLDVVSLVFGLLSVIIRAATLVVCGLIMGTSGTDPEATERRD